MPSNIHPVAARTCGWDQNNGGPFEIAFFKWNQPLTESAWVGASKDQVYNTPLDYESGLGSWAVGEDQSLTKQDYALMVGEGDGSWSFEVNVGDVHTVAELLPIARLVQSLLGSGASVATTPTTTSTVESSASAPPCNAASLATAASSYEQRNGNPDGSGSKINAVVCATGYAAASYSPGNDPNTGATMAFQQTGSAWTALGSGNILPPNLGIPPAIYAQLNQELGASPTPQSASF